MKKGLVVIILIVFVMIFLFYFPFRVDLTGNAVWGWGWCDNGDGERCPAGEGDCDGNSDCLTGYCHHNVGGEYGKSRSMDVCECPNERPVWNKKKEECVKEFIKEPIKETTPNLAPFPTKASQIEGTLKKFGIIDSGEVDLQNYYLLEGDQTKITNLIKELAAEIPEGKSDRETVQNILEWENQYFKKAKRKCEENNIDVSSDAVKRTRTSHEVLETICPTGCTDFALVFVALAREKGIPATITETISEGWVYEMVQNNEFDNSKRGHFFSEVYLSDEEKWEVVDPTAASWTAKTEDGKYLLRHSGEERGTGTFMIIFERGLDPWDYGTKTMGDFVEVVKKRYYIGGIY